MRRLTIFTFVVLMAVFAASFCVLLTAAPAVAQAEGTVYLPTVMSDFVPGWHWEEAYTVTVSARTTGAPLAVIDRSGQPHLFWYYTTADNQLHHTHFTATGWRETQPAAGAEGDSLLTNAPLVDSAGKLHLIWFNKLDSDEEQKHRFLYTTFAEESWQAPRAVMRSKYSTIDAWLRLVPGDQPRVAVTDGFLAWKSTLYTLGGDWQAQSETALPDGADIVWPDAVSGAHLYGNNDDTMQYWRWTGGEVGGAQTLGSGAFFGRSLAFDASDNLHLYWKASVAAGGKSVTTLHHQCINTLPQASAVTYPGDVVAVQEIAGAAEHGTWFVLAWQETTRKRIMRWDGCAPGGAVTIPEDAAENTTLRAVAVSSNPRKVCVFMQQGTTAIYTVRCADLDY